MFEFIHARNNGKKMIGAEIGVFLGFNAKNILKRLPIETLYLIDPYVGYTPGYIYSYPYHGTIVYGTGYYYRPWYRRYYYPRPVTYGYGVHYNPYTGWGFSVGVSYGWVGYNKVIVR